MIAIETWIMCPATPEIVWELITDWEHQDDWMLEASDFVVTSDEREGIGVEAEATVRIAGIATRDRIRVVGWEPGHRLALIHLGWVSGRGEIHLTLIDDSNTYVFWREEFSPPLGLLGAIGMLGFKPLMRRIFQRDLRVLASLSRARAAGTRQGS